MVEEEEQTPDDEGLEQETGPDEPVEDPPAKKRSYLRPVLLVTLLILLMLIIWMVSPALADPVEVGLDDEGSRFVDESLWFVNDDRNASQTAFGGLVHVDSVQLSRNVSAQAQETAAVYLWANVKIPAMLPRDMVEERMRELTIEQMASSHVEIVEEPKGVTDREENGKSLQVTFHTAHASNESAFRKELELDVFVATWQCSVMGSYAVVIGIALKDYSEYELTAEDADPYHEMQTQLLPHTVCLE